MLAGGASAGVGAPLWLAAVVATAAPPSVAAVATAAAVAGAVPAAGACAGVGVDGVDAVDAVCAAVAAARLALAWPEETCREVVDKLGATDTFVLVPEVVTVAARVC